MTTYKQMLIFSLLCFKLSRESSGFCVSVHGNYLTNEPAFPKHGKISDTFLEYRKIVFRFLNKLLDNIGCAMIFFAAYIVLSKKAFNPLSDICDDNIQDILYNEWVCVFLGIRERNLKIAFCLSRPVDAIRINFLNKGGVFSGGHTIRSRIKNAYCSFMCEPLLSASIVENGGRLYE